MTSGNPAGEPCARSVRDEERAAAHSAPNAPHGNSRPVESADLSCARSALPLTLRELTRYPGVFENSCDLGMKQPEILALIPAETLLCPQGERSVHHLLKLALVVEAQASVIPIFTEPRRGSDLFVLSRGAFW